MTKSQREALRLFYQSIPTQEEKDAFNAVLGMSKEARIKYLADLAAKNIPVTPELQLIILTANLTKEDRIMIFSGVVRQWIFRLISLIGLSIAFLLPSIVQAGTVEVTWKANTEPDLAGYRVYIGTVSGEYADPIEVKQPSCTVTLSPETGMLYYFAVTAFDTSNRESVPSDEAVCFVPDNNAPETPGMITIIVRP